MRFDFAAIYAKLERAVAHTDKLDERIKSVEKENPNELSLELDQRSGQFSVRVLGVHQVQPECSFILSEAIHHYRSALDHVIFEMSRRPGGEGARRVRFPIYDSEAAFKSHHGPRAVSLMALTNQAVVRRLQPYKRRPDAPSHDPLSLLDELWNIDKHRTLLIAVRRVNIKDIRPVYRDGRLIDFRTRLGDAVPGTVVADGLFVPSGPRPRITFQTQLSAKVSFGKGCGAAERYEVVPLLRQFEDDIRLNILPKLHRQWRIPSGD